MVHCKTMDNDRANFKEPRNRPPSLNDENAPNGKRSRFSSNMSASLHLNDDSKGKMSFFYVYACDILISLL